MATYYKGNNFMATYYKGNNFMAKVCTTGEQFFNLRRLNNSAPIFSSNRVVRNAFKWMKMKKKVRLMKQ